MRAFLAGVFVLALSSTTFAELHTIRIPLQDGKIGTAALTAALCEKLHLPAVDFGGVSVDLSSYRGGLFVQALNTSLGDGCQVDLEKQELVLHVDSAKLPHDRDALKQVIRVFTATAAPDATAAQRATWGLTMPATVDETRPLVVLIHGLDCNQQNWGPMADLLREQGFQVGYFAYPSDGPIADSAALLSREMTALHEVFPRLKSDIIAFSMGGLVARGYVESPQYAGGVDRLIMLGTPNGGSDWAGYRWMLELKEHYQLWKNEPKWRWTWMITDGLGEAGRDLASDSKFIQNVESLPRRGSVRYTIIAGSQHPAYPWLAWALEGSSQGAPVRVASWWGIRQTEAALHRYAERARLHTGASDGPVKVASATLAGVDDMVTLPVDHYSLYYPTTSKTPAAWDIVLNRLRN